MNKKKTNIHGSLDKILKQETNKNGSLDKILELLYIIIFSKFNKLLFSLQG